MTSAATGCCHPASLVSSEQVYAQLPPEPPGGRRCRWWAIQRQGQGQPGKNDNPENDVLEAPDRSRGSRGAGVPL